MENLIAYLRSRYDPVGLICYGSYRDGTRNEQSDFDALLLIREGKCVHDISEVGGVQMDVFVYPQNWTFAPEDFVQLYDGAVIIDETGAAAQLLHQVRQYVDKYPRKTQEEKHELKSWCTKMLFRAKRTDAEGSYRSHWLLTDSLQIYCDIRDRFYFGPKKTILWMQKYDPKGFALLSKTMDDRSSLDLWINYIFEVLS